MEDHEIRLVVDFAQGGLSPGQEAEFAVRHGCALEELDKMPPASQHVYYKCHAVFRGGLRLLRREGEADPSYPPWIISSSGKTWAMIPQVDDPPEIDVVALAAWYLLFLLAVGSLVYVIGAIVGNWDWPW